MTLLAPPHLSETLSNDTLLVDTTTLINTAKSTEYLKFLSEIVAGGCALVTIPSVVFEFTRGAQNTEEVRKQHQFIKDLGIVVLSGVEEKVQKDTNQIFLMIYNKHTSIKGDKGASYTDSLLCTTAYAYNGSATGLKVLTANHRDIPSALFDREYLITFDVNNELRTEAIYKLSSAKLGRELDKLMGL